jgi:hypothetical protein
MNFHNLFLLPHFLAKEIGSRELLVDYSQSNVTSIEYLIILQKNIMDKVVVEQIIEGR